MKPATTARPWRVELRAMISLAIPVVVVQLGLMSFGVVDTMMLGRYSPESLAAAGLGHIFGMMILLAGYGLILGLDPLTSQAFGAGRMDAVSAHFKRGIVIALGLTVVSTIAMYGAAPFMTMVDQDESLIGPASDYVKIVAWGNLGFLSTVALRTTLQSMNIMAPLVKATLIGNAFNIAGNRILIWGEFGFPEMGLNGSAITTACSRMLLFLSFAYFSRSHWMPLLKMKTDGATKRGYRALIALGFPLSIQISLEAGVFNAVGFLMGTKGVVPMAGNGVTLNVGSLVFMIPMGLGAAAATRVGNAIGAGDQDRAGHAAKIAFSLTSTFMLMSGIVFIAAPAWVAGLYSNDPEVIAFAATLIPVAGYFSIFDGLQCVSHGVLRGMADTKIPAAMSLIAFWVIGLPFGYYLDRHTSVGPPGLWWGLVAGLGGMAIALGWRIIKKFKAGLVAYAAD